MLFAQAFPLAPLLFIFSNLIELKSTINKLSFYSKRFQALPAKGIGHWLQIGEVSFLLLIKFLDSWSRECWSQLCHSLLYISFHR